VRMYRSVRLTAVGLLVAGMCAVTAAVPSVAAVQGRGAMPRVQLAVQGELTSVAASSARNAWAVGSTGAFGGVGTLIAHWDGRRWRRVRGPSPGTGDSLNGVTAVSARDAWAVGGTEPGVGPDGEEATLILHWNGRAWRRVASPSPAPDCDLMAVAAISARSAWAVGYADPSGGDLPSGARVVIARTLILHWNGTAWRRVRSPNPDQGGHLMGVAALSARRAWAVGSDEYQTTDFANLILKWNGTSWKRTPSPNPSGHGNALVDVAALSRRSAWAVGDVGTNRVLMAHWNGIRWRRKAIPAGRYSLSGVAAFSADSAWAVGGSSGGVLILHWNGTRWRRVAAHGPRTSYLTGVAAVSARSAWAVGTISRSSGSTTLILHWNGARWT
jgi:hypothetical protein